ncbi:MAG: glycosyltransferase family 2 protein [Pseudomonadota bacterium]
MSRITAYIIAYNQAEKIADAVNSVLWADEVLLVDSHSTDGTDRIAAGLGARVVHVPFAGFGALRNAAIDACTGEWVFSLDSDERCTPEARDEMLRIISAPESADAYFVPRRNHFMGRWIRFSGYYPDYRQPQLFRKGALRYRPDMVHETYELLTDRAPGVLTAAIWQVPYVDLAELQNKITRYSSLGADQMQRTGRTAGLWTALGHGGWAFFHQYVIKLGVLDGWAGFVLALSNFEATFYKYAKRAAQTADWVSPASPPLLRQEGAMTSKTGSEQRGAH